MSNLYKASNTLGLPLNSKYDSLEDIIDKADSFDLGLLDHIYAKLSDYHPDDFYKNERSEYQLECDEKTILNFKNFLDESSLIVAKIESKKRKDSGHR
jgi:hypothetical protein